ncbi:cyclodeaminase/cyclohydrolase family protein [Clostridium carnis]
MLFKDYNINQFVLELSSDAPSPGGGSTAALVSALAASLNSMVYSLTVGKKSFDILKDEEKEKMIEFREKAKKFTTVSQEFMEKDREDFVGLMASYKLAKNTEEEKNNRSKAIQENTVKAMRTPLNLAENALEFYENIKFAVKFGNKNLVSDAGVAAILLHGAIESAILNVKVNLNSLRNEEFFLDIDKRCKEIIKESLEEKEKIVIEVNNVIYPNN